MQSHPATLRCDPLSGNVLHWAALSALYIQILSPYWLSLSVEIRLSSPSNVKAETPTCASLPSSLPCIPSYLSTLYVVSLERAVGSHSALAQVLFIKHLEQFDFPSTQANKSCSAKTFWIINSIRIFSCSYFTPTWHLKLLLLYLPFYYTLLLFLVFILVALS